MTCARWKVKSGLWNATIRDAAVVSHARVDRRQPIVVIDECNVKLPGSHRNGRVIRAPFKQFRKLLGTAIRDESPEPLNDFVLLIAIRVRSARLPLFDPALRVHLPPSNHLLQTLPGKVLQLSLAGDPSKLLSERAEVRLQVSHQRLVRYFLGESWQIGCRADRGGCSLCLRDAQEMLALGQLPPLLASMRG